MPVGSTSVRPGAGSTVGAWTPSSRKSSPWRASAPVRRWSPRRAPGWRRWVGAARAVRFASTNHRRANAAAHRRPATRALFACADPPKFDQNFSMAAPASLDLRRRVVEAYERGGVTYAQGGERFAVGRATVNRWLRRFRETRS